MTPADYLASIVLPTLAEFHSDPSDPRRAYLACIVSAHMIDHVVKAGVGSKAVVRAAVRAQGNFAGECLDLVEAVCNGTKHAAPDRAAHIKFAPGHERAFKANSLGGVLAARLHRRWGRPGLGVERDEEDRFIDESVEGVVAAFAMAFPALFPEVDPLTVAPWLRATPSGRAP